MTLGGRTASRRSTSDTNPTAPGAILGAFYGSTGRGSDPHCRYLHGAGSAEGVSHHITAYFGRDLDYVEIILALHTTYTLVSGGIEWESIQQV